MKAVSPRRSSDRRQREVLLGQTVAFLISQVGAHASRLWAAQLGSIGLETREVMLFWNVALAEGRSQREIAQALHIPSSRVVALVDALEERGWLIRRTDVRDRRARALYLTARGRKELKHIVNAGAEVEAKLVQELTATERRRLIATLRRLARTQGLIARVHPDF